MDDLDAFLEGERKKCERKREYATRHIAKLAAQRGSAKYGEKMEPYRCPYCRVYHITRVKPKRRDNRPQSGNTLES
jgi:tRNA G26 N,N-dimethylase Trm1